MRDILILSWNEGNKIYTKSTETIHPQCINYINKIIDLDYPAFVFVGTQESRSKKDNYQNVLEIELKKIGYILLLKSNCNNSSIKTTIAGLASGNSKNVRTRVYYKSDKVSYNISHMYKDSSNENESYTDRKLKLDDKYEQKYVIHKVGVDKSKYSGFGNVSGATAFKGAIFIRLEFYNTHTKKIIKIVYINTHLEFGEQSNGTTKFSRRKEQFMKLITEYKLAILYDDGYNIFFGGDLNFRLFKGDINTPIRNKDKVLEISEEIIKLFNSNHSNNANHTNHANHANHTKNINHTNIKNELYYTIQEGIKKNIYSEKTHKLMSEILKYAKLFGIHLSCKIQEKNGANKPKCSISRDSKGEYIKDEKAKYNCVLPYKKNIIEKGYSLFSLRKEQPKNGFRIPSMCDKILCALHNNISVKKNDFGIFNKVYPGESDHYQIYLSVLIH